MDFVSLPNQYLMLMRVARKLVHTRIQRKIFHDRAPIPIDIFARSAVPTRARHPVRWHGIASGRRYALWWITKFLWWTCPDNVDDATLGRIEAAANGKLEPCWPRKEKNNPFDVDGEVG